MRQQQQRAQLEALKQKQAEEQKKRLEENRKRLEEQNRLREQQQQEKMAQMKAQQEQLMKTRQEEMEKKKREVAQARAEQEAVLKIRRAMQRFKACNLENHDQYKADFEEAQKTELPNCGSQAEKIQKECVEAIEATAQRMVQLEEQRQAAEEKKRAEKERRQECRKKAAELVEQLSKLIDEAEAAGKAVEKASEPWGEGKDMNEKKIEETATAVEGAITEATAKLQTTSEFISKETNTIRDVPPIEGEPPSEAPITLSKINQRVSILRKALEAATGSNKASKEAKVKKWNAQQEVAKQHKVFAKYDKDKDGKLSKTEIQAFAKGEYKFTIPAASLDQICGVLIPAGAKGVAKDNFHKVRSAVGIAREVVADAKLREERIQKEKEIAEAKEKMQASMEQIKKDIAIVEEEIKEQVDSKVTPAAIIAAGKTSSSEMISTAEAIEAVVAKAKEHSEAVKETVTALNEGVDADLKSFADYQRKALESSMRTHSARLAQATNKAAKLKADAERKQKVELEALRLNVLKIIRHHNTVKKLDGKASFAAAASNDKIGEAEFVKFVQGCEREEPAEGETVDKSTPSEADLGRLFPYIEENGEGHFTEESWSNLVRIYMKVAKATVITKELSLKSETLRRVEAGEVVELLEAPTKEEESGVERAKVRAMNDGVEGFVAAVGDEGTKFLEAGGSTFKVVKETIVTASFELAGDKDDSKKLKDTTRKLKVGETVEVREWAKKEEASGLMRMKVRVKSDGQVGWATSVGNTGIVFLEVA